MSLCEAHSFGQNLFTNIQAPARFPRMSPRLDWLGPCACASGPRSADTLGNGHRSKNQHPYSHPMKQINPKLLPGLHVAFVANFSGGCGGSMLALETYATCRNMGIPAILATNDRSHDYPNMGSDLWHLPVISAGDPDPDQLHHLDDIAYLVDEARAKRKFLVIDLKAGYAPAHRMLMVLRDNGIFRASSFAALVPVISGDFGNQGVCGAATALQALAKMRIHVDRGIIRTWPLPGEPALPDISTLEPFPIWSAEHLHQHTRAMIHHGYWNIRQAKISQIFQRPQRDRITVAKVIAHFESAQKSIYEAIIAPVTRSYPGPIPTCMPDLIPKNAASSLQMLAKTVLQKVEAMAQPENNPSHAIIVTMIAGKLMRWHHSGRWIAYTTKPGDTLKVWTPPD